MGGAAEIGIRSGARESRIESFIDSLIYRLGYTIPLVNPLAAVVGATVTGSLAVGHLAVPTFDYWTQFFAGITVGEILVKIPSFYQWKRMRLTERIRKFFF